MSDPLGTLADVEPRRCDWCSTHYQPARSTSRTCSPPCRRKLNNAEQNAKRHVHLSARECRACGTTFQPARGDSWTCSNRCWQRARYVPAQHPTTCIGCGARFTANRSDRRVCSNACYLRVWRAAHPGHHRLEVAAYGKRRAAWILLDGGIAESDWRRQLARQGGHCYYCARPTDAMHMEHVVPLSRGGRHRIGNVVGACPSCNGSKGTRFLSEWRYRYRARLQFSRGVSSWPTPTRATEALTA